MDAKHVIIVGGGLAGLSAGCFARASGFRTTLVEHNIALGGVCTAWKRGPYLIDGCIHWLTGGPFLRVYEELGVLQQLRLKTIEHFVSIRDIREGTEIAVTADLPAFFAALEAIAPEDREELHRIREAVGRAAEMRVDLDIPPELQTLGDGLRGFWSMRHLLPDLVHFRQPLGVFAAERLQSARLARIFRSFVPDEAPALFLLFMLGYLQRGWLSRPWGGTAAFRDALIASYNTLGGETRLHETVEEVIVRDGRARGVRLADGTLLEADAVVCTSSAPETIFRLLGGAFGATETRTRMERWKMFRPIVLASYGVSIPLEDQPQMLRLNGLDFEAGGRRNQHLTLRIYNDDPAFAPPGHTVVQALIETTYDYWATRGTDYVSEKQATGERLLAELDRHLPGVKAAAQVSDLATPLTYWNMARSWRGAFEGWMPNQEAMFGHVRKKLEGLEGFYMAGQWVEPGGGVPAACASGRAAVQLLCADTRRPFTPPHTHTS